MSSTCNLIASGNAMTQKNQKNGHLGLAKEAGKCRTELSLEDVVCLYTMQDVLQPELRSCELAAAYSPAQVSEPSKLLLVDVDCLYRLSSRIGWLILFRCRAYPA